jgi:hypothetical protein
MKYLKPSEQLEVIISSMAISRVSLEHSDKNSVAIIRERSSVIYHSLLMTESLRNVRLTFCCDMA